MELEEHSCGDQVTSVTEAKLRSKPVTYPECFMGPGLLGCPKNLGNFACYGPLLETQQGQDRGNISPTLTPVAIPGWLSLFTDPHSAALPAKPWLARILSPLGSVEMSLSALGFFSSAARKKPDSCTTVPTAHGFNSCDRAPAGPQGCLAIFLRSLFPSLRPRSLLSLLSSNRQQPSPSMFTS